MPKLTRWYIKSSLFYFITAVFIGIGIKANLGYLSFFSSLTPVYYHLFMLGWVTQLIFGVSFWMFPRHTREKPRGNEPLAWAVFFLLNTGILMRAISEPVSLFYPSVFWSITLLISAIFQWAAGVGYVIHIWKRVK